MSTGDLAKELECGSSTIAYYKQLGLLVPKMHVGSTDVYNTKETIKLVEKIRSLRGKGIRLNEMKGLL